METQGSAQERLREAVRAHRRGWALTPLRGKVPILKGWQSAPYPSEADVSAWAIAGNIGLRTGQVSGIVVIDLEANADPAPLGDLPMTVEVRTGGGGRHLYFNIPDGVQVGNNVRKIGPRIDVRGTGGQVVYVGSTHPRTRLTYEWTEGRSPDDIPVAELPAHLVERVRKPTPKESAQARDRAAFKKIMAQAGIDVFGSTSAYGRAALIAECERVSKAPIGTRNDTFNMAVFAVGQLVGGGEVAEGDARAALLASAPVSDTFPEKEALDVFERALRAGMQSPRSAPGANGHAGHGPEREPDDIGGSPGLPDESGATADDSVPPSGTLNDIGNAHRLAKMHGERLAYASGLGWLCYDGRRWNEDEGRVVERAKESARAIHREAESAPDHLQTDLARWALSSGDAKRIRACLDMAKSEPAMSRRATDFDSDPWTLNVENGTLDLRSGTIRAHSKDDLLRKMAPCEYDERATAPTFRAFLERIIPDPDVRAYLRRFLGYCLTGETREHAFGVWHGEGANGKTTLIEAVRGAMGPYAAAASFSTFTVNRSGSGPRNDLASLVGSRMVTASESAEGEEFASEFLKKVTGDDVVSARFLYREQFEFKPTFKIVLATNHKPTVKDPTQSIWRRLHLVPFAVKIPAGEQDKTLAAKLALERAGILAWMVTGCVEWQRVGLAPPEAVRIATEAYRTAEDTVRAFVEDSCVVGSDDFQAKIGALYSAFCKWAKEAGEKPLSMKMFAERLSLLGYREMRRRDARWRMGIALRQGEAERDPREPGED